MTSTETLVLVAALIYSWECIKWIPRGSRALCATEFGRKRIAPVALNPVHVLSNQHGGLAFAPIFRPGSPVFISGSILVEAGVSVTVASPDRIRREVERFRLATRSLRAVTAALGIVTFGVFAPLALIVGIAETAWITLPPMAVCHLVALILFWSAHARLYPKKRGDRFLAIFEKSLLPPANIRSLDKLSQALLAKYHPLSIAAALAPAQTLPHLTRDLIRSLDASKRPALLAAAAKLRISLDSLDGPPVRESDDVRYYCPECQAQFIRDAGLCPDCRHATLVAFPACDEDGR
jgi:hypothetical protein